eukprot:COSAG06_NODE_8302_length_2208_cov_2.801802_3_plen_105_part_00
MIVVSSPSYNMEAKGVFLATFVEEDSVVEACEERLSFLQLSLCLSRACLGKMIIFSIKWHHRAKKGVSRTSLHQHRAPLLFQLRTVPVQHPVCVPAQVVELRFL